MAGVALLRGIFLPMALGTPLHRWIIFFPQRVTRRNRTVTRFAVKARFEVDAVAKEHVFGDSVNSHPGDRIPGPGEFGEFLNVRLIRSDRGVARNALVGGGNLHSCPRIWIGVAILAL
jgi:hypothetical protein